MGKIGDLFVRLGLKKEGFSKGMQDAKKETQSFGDKLKGIKATAVAVWAAIGAAVMKFAKDFIYATNVTADWWDKKVSGMGARFHTFLVQLQKTDWSKILTSPQEKFKTLFAGAINRKVAAKAAEEMTEAFDAAFELEQSVKLQEQAIRRELNDLMIAMRDRTLTPAERQAAADRYRALLEPIADAEVRVYGDMREKALLAWQKGTSLDRIYSTDEMVEFFSFIGTNAAEMEKKFPDLYKVFQTEKGDKQNLPIFEIIARYEEAANKMSNVDKELSRITNSIKAEIFKSLEDIQKWANSIGKEEIKLDLDFDLDTDLADELAELEEWIDADTAALAESLKNKLGSEYAKIEQLNQMLGNSLTDAFSSGLQAMTDFIAGVDSASVEQVMQAFIQPIAGMMKHMGEMFMAEGIAEMELITGTPAQKIAAGAALIAVSSAISSGLSKMSATLGGGGTTASTAQSSTASAQQLEQEITINVVGEISGDKIILAGQKTLNKWSR